MPNKAVSDGIRKAREIRDKLGISPFQPLDVRSAARELGLLIARRPFAARRIAGIYVFRPEIKLGFAVINSSDPIARQHFTMAHELGHHTFDGQAIVDDLTLADLKNPVEARANGFAAEFLLPEAAVKEWTPQKAWGQSADDIARLALNFGISFEATVWRLLAAGCIDDAKAAIDMREQVDSELRRKLVEGRDEHTDLPAEFISLVEDAYKRKLISKGKRDELLKSEAEEVVG